MTNQKPQREIGSFIFGLRVVEYLDGQIEPEFQIASQNIPIEFVIMQIKAFLNNQEKSYFSKFDKSFSEDFKDNKK